MATISNTPRPGYVWDSADNVWYPIGVGGHSHPDYITQATAVNPTLIDAKGDIITATAADTPARLAVGNNGETLVANSAASSGLQYNANFSAGKNAIINGDFKINQRNFTSITANGDFGFDRFLQLLSGGTVTSTPQVFTIGAAPVAGYEATNYWQMVTSGQSAASDRAVVAQRLEDVRSLAGQTITVSFWAKANTGTPKMAVEIAQYFGLGGSPSSTVNTYVGQVTLSTSWVRYSVSATIPSISGKTIGTTAGSSYVQVNLYTSAGTDFNARTGSMGVQNNTFGIWGVQVEAGSVATAFQTATGTLQGELAACQRYYYRMTATDAAYSTFANGYYSDSTTLRADIKMPVTMRTVPSAVEYSSLAGYYVSVIAITAVVFDSNFNNRYNSRINCTVSGATAGNPAALIANASTSAYLAVTAEL